MLWSAWYPFVKPEVGAAPEPLIDHHIRQAAIDFCEQSQLWTADHAAISLVADTGTYSLTSPVAESDISMIKWAWVDGVQILPASQEELGRLTQYWATMTGGSVGYYTQLDADSITLFPIPNYASTGGLKLKLVLHPALDATGIPDWIGIRYVEEIANGAKSRLLGMVGSPWATAEGEAKYSAMYAVDLRDAKIEGNKSLTRTNSTIRFPKYGR